LCNLLASILTGNRMVQRRRYPDKKTKNREVLRAWRKTKKSEAQPYYTKRAEARQHLEDISTLEAKQAQGVYDVIVIDPPWPVHFGVRALFPNKESLPYPTMSLEEIRGLHLPLADVAHVWLWTTNRFLPEAFHCLDAWGLRYSCCFLWEKNDGMRPMGLPRMLCEFALYARKGSALFLDTTAFDTLVKAPRRGGHSAKPDAFYDMVRRVTAGRRLDMFGRRSIEGFDSWGAEAPGEEGHAGNVEGAL
jgi:N6-adenosine-specific RNA methylase IME4